MCRLQVIDDECVYLVRDVLEAIDNILEVIVELGPDDKAHCIALCVSLPIGKEEPLAAHDRAATYVNRGILLMTRGQYRGADADFNSALGIDRGLSDAWLNKGFLRLRTGSGREALPLLQKGIDAGTNRQALALFARGVAYEQMGEFRSAYADLKRAHALEPKWSLPTEYLASYQVVSR